MRTYNATLRHASPEGVPIEDTCLGAALPCPLKPVQMAHRLPKRFCPTMTREQIAKGARVVQRRRRDAAQPRGSAVGQHRSAPAPDPAPSREAGVDPRPRRQVRAGCGAAAGAPAARRLPGKPPILRRLVAVFAQMRDTEKAAAFLCAYLRTESSRSPCP